MMTIDAIYNAIAYAETGGEQNPWIRTKVKPIGGSTAYGPVQLTITKAKDYIHRYEVLRQYEEFISIFEHQAQKFIRWGGVFSIPYEFMKYDYGGVGDIGGNSPCKFNYIRYAKALMQIDLYAVNYNLGRFIERWRGVPECEDPGYFEKVKNRFYQEV